MEREGPLSEPRPAEWVEVWQQADGFWRWRYRNTEERVDLLSNEGHPSLEQAVRAASTAYPEVPVIELRPRPASPTQVGAALRAVAVALLALVALLLGILALPVVAAVKLRRLVLRLRRRRS